jgi:hypothetical protein
VRAFRSNHDLHMIFLLSGESLHAPALDRAWVRKYGSRRYPAVFSFKIPTLTVRFFALVFSCLFFRIGRRAA